jgi:hypothetical protein
VFAILSNSPDEKVHSDQRKERVPNGTTRMLMRTATAGTRG